MRGYRGISELSAFFGPRPHILCSEKIVRLATCADGADRARLPPDTLLDGGLDVGRTRVSVREAARILDVSESAIHKRVRRDTLPHDKGPDGRVFVYLDDVTDTVSDTVQHPSTDALISEMRDRIESLERQLEREREANSENRRIIAALVQRVPELAAPSEARGGPLRGSEDSGGAEDGAATGGAHSGLR